MEQTQPEMHSESVRPLESVKVVDLSRLVSGKMLTHVLADLGSTVIKVEPPARAMSFGHGSAQE